LRVGDQDDRYWERLLEEDGLGTRRPSKEIPTDPHWLDSYSSEEVVDRVDEDSNLALETIIATLTEEECELVRLRFYDKLSLRQISRRMGYNTHRTAQWRLIIIFRKLGSEINDK